MDGNIMFILKEMEEIVIFILGKTRVVNQNLSIMEVGKGGGRP